MARVENYAKGKCNNPENHDTIFRPLLWRDFDFLYILSDNEGFGIKRIMMCRVGNCYLLMALAWCFCEICLAIIVTFGFMSCWWMRESISFVLAKSLMMTWTEAKSSAFLILTAFRHTYKAMRDGKKCVKKHSDALLMCEMHFFCFSNYPSILLEKNGYWKKKHTTAGGTLKNSWKIHIQSLMGNVNLLEKMMVNGRKIWWAQSHK